MNPGGTNLRAVSDFSHETISEYAAASVPCATTAVGDEGRTGVRLNLSGRRHQPVHLEWWRSGQGRLPSVALAGELGAGKTWAIMTMLFHLVDIGGQFLSIDRTDQGSTPDPPQPCPAHHRRPDAPGVVAGPAADLPRRSGCGQSRRPAHPCSGAPRLPMGPDPRQRCCAPKWGCAPSPICSRSSSRAPTQPHPAGGAAARRVERTVPAPVPLGGPALRGGGDGPQPAAGQPRRPGHRHPAPTASRSRRWRRSAAATR